MNFEKMWMKKKVELIDIIEAGKEAEKAKEYTVELHEKVRAGERAEEELLGMLKAEIDEYFKEVRNNG